jgi:transposase InsO family protein
VDIDMATSEAYAIASRRCAAVRAVRELGASLGTARAVQQLAAELGVSERTLWRWTQAVDGIEESEWLARHLPGWRSAAELEEVHPDAWTFLKSDYLRPARPAWAACYRRLLDAAHENGWAPIPSSRSLSRRLEREVAPSIVTLKREGEKALAAALPSQRRTKEHLGAMAWVNADGHKLDVFASWPRRDGVPRIMRPILVAWQDVYSGKILGWRIDETENVDAVRLAFADMLSAYGIPDRATVDNGHAFAGKEMTGGSPNRHRFGWSGDEVEGIYHALGIDPHFTLPYNGRAKPIERAWRDLAEEIARHPLCAGAYTGHSPMAKPADYGTRAIPIAELEAHVRTQIERHNARSGRQSPSARGRSFDATFAASYETRIIRRATEAQIRWLLLPSQVLTVSRLESTVTILGNRYHAPALIERRGQKVVAKYDPCALHDGVWIFEPGALEPLCHAPCLAPVGFGDTDAARRDGRARRAQVRAVKEAAAAHQTLRPDELVEAAKAPRAPASKVVAGHFGRAVPDEARPKAPADDKRRADDFLERFAARNAG